MPFALDDFDLIERIGRGATSEVWRARHRRFDLPVAVKVLLQDETWDDRHELFGTELRAVAGLEHAGIAMLFDHGTVPDGHEGPLRPGAPYLVTELASGGTLADLSLPIAWNTAYALTMSLLDALAHAHARGVVHKDLKPANVLLCDRTDVRPGPKLVDFGIAHALHSDERRELLESRIVGSPAYMAPEQFRGEWRDYGPWTDLYALGCIVFEFVAGRRAFAGKRLAELALAHQTHPIPPLPLDADVPVGFEAWLGRLLAKDPRHRFQRAADAAWSLRALAGSSPDRAAASAALFASPSDSARAADPTPASGSLAGVRLSGALDAVGRSLSLHTLQTLVDTLDEPRIDQTQELGTEGNTLGRFDSTNDQPPPTDLFDRHLGSGPHAPAAPAVAPMPDRWRHARRLEHRLVGAALGLVGLRRAPFVGRVAERDAAWAALAEVRASGQPRVLVVRGPSGAGKSRLAEWIARHADEVGAARVVAAPHRPDATDDGLARMLAAELGCLGLDASGVEHRMRTLTGNGRVANLHDADALAALLRGGEHGIAGILTGGEARLALVSRVVRTLTADRPVIAWIDDAQWGGEALQWTRFVLERTRSGDRAMPVLLVLTVRDEGLVAGSLEAQLLDWILDDERTRELRLEPLSPGEQVQLIEGFLGLDRALAARIADRTDGNPLFAVELVSDWVSRGVLVAGPGGFVLDGPEPSLPDDLHQVWTSRIDGRDGMDGAVGLALEVAAALGQEIDADEWADGCRRRGIPVPPRLMDTLLDERLVVVADGGWAFSHGMLRESLERRAKEADRWIDHNAACAAMIEARYPPGSPGRAARLARHLFASGDSARALPEFWKATEERERVSDFIGALAQLVGATACLDALGRADDDRDRAYTRLLRARAHAGQRDVDAAAALAASALTAARANGWSDIEAGANEELGSIYRQRSAFAEARDHLEAARRGYEATRDRRGLARALRLLAWVAILQGDRPTARELVADSHRLFEAEGDKLGVAWCLRSIGDIARLDGDLQSAHDHFAAARDAFAHAGHTSGVSECVHGLAEVLRYQGRLDEAAEAYERSIALDRSVGARDPIIPTLNLGLCELARGRHAEARQRLEQALRAFEREGQDGHAGVTHACLMPVTAALADYPAFDRHVAMAEEVIADTDFVDPDIADVAHRAFDILAATGQAQRAARARRLARAQYEALGADDELARLERGPRR